MTFPKNSLVLVDYTAKIKDTDDIVESTYSEDEEQVSAPKLVSIGNVTYPVLSGFDVALESSDVGQSNTVDVSPEQAFGVRSRHLIKMLNYRKLGDDADKVTVGDIITVDGKKGEVRFMSSGRVQVDFNHRYAGKTIQYDYTVIKSLEDTAEKIDAILGEAGIADKEYVLKDDVLEVKILSSSSQDPKLQNKKHLLQMSLFGFIPTLSAVRFIETYKNSAKTTSDNDESQSNTQVENPDS